LCAALASAVLGGCAELPVESGPREILDEVTGATLIAVPQPIVFARERRDLAANVRDYVTLSTVAVNRAGKIHYLLLAYVWSTVDARAEAAAAARSGGSVDSKDGLVIAADDRRIALQGSQVDARDAGVTLPVGAPPHFKGTPKAFATDIATLRFIAAARRLAVQLGEGDTAPSYDVWTDGRPELRAFVQSMDVRR
jgi:hypothetical protein